MLLADKLVEGARSHPGGQRQRLLKVGFVAGLEEGGRLFARFTHGFASDTTRRTRAFPSAGGGMALAFDFTRPTLAAKMTGRTPGCRPGSPGPWMFMSAKSLSPGY